MSRRVITPGLPRPVPPAGSYVYTSSHFTQGTSNALGNGSMKAIPWLVDQPVTITRIGADVATVGEAGSKFRLGLYADNGNAYPGALLLDAGQIAGDSATIQELTVSLTLPPGLYWVTGVVQSAPTTQPTMRTAGTWTSPVMLSATASIPAANSSVTGYLQTGVTGALPANWSTSVAVTGVVARIFVKI